MAVAFFVENTVRPAETNSYSSAKTSRNTIEESDFYSYSYLLIRSHAYIQGYSRVVVSQLKIIRAIELGCIGTPTGSILPSSGTTTGLRITGA